MLANASTPISVADMLVKPRLGLEHVFLVLAFLWQKWQSWQSAPIPMFREDSMKKHLLHPLMVDLIIEAVEKGVTRKEIADLCQVGERTLYRWIATGRALYVQWQIGSLAAEELSHIEKLQVELFEGVMAAAPHAWDVEDHAVKREELRLRAEAAERRKEDRDFEQQAASLKRNADAREKRAIARKQQKRAKDNRREL